MRVKKRKSPQNLVKLPEDPMRRLITLVFLVFLSLGTLSSTPSGKQANFINSGKAAREDLSQYYKKWLGEDASYIIADEERSVFKRLINDEERNSFIEQFWNRRNPDPYSSVNSFKEEHYRRIAYANEHFASGIPGWKTDRGRIYIMYGKPDDTEVHPTAEIYFRPATEGSGTVTAFPFEKWWYRHMDGIGDGVMLEFVDSSMNGEYHLAVSPDEKDALMNMPNSCATLAEELGRNWDIHINIPGDPNAVINPVNMDKGAQNMPFTEMEQIIDYPGPPKIKFKDLKTAVETQLHYDGLAYDVKTDCLKKTDQSALALITIELNNSELEFKREEDFNRATVNVYGRATSPSGAIKAEWEDVITRDFNDILFQNGKNRPSEYQKIIALDAGQTYKLDLILKDLNSDKMGTLNRSLDIPKYAHDALQSSSILLAKDITQARMKANKSNPYIIGDMRIVPMVKHEYTANQYLLPYMQIYNMQADPTNLKPSLDVAFLLKINGDLVEEFKSTAVNSAQFFYNRRVVLAGKIPLRSLKPGKYTLEIKVQDTIANRSLSTSTDFSVRESKPPISSAAP
jgi:GWxTD domain-containing protein